jgi:hypothetical protein
MAIRGVVQYDDLLLLDHIMSIVTEFTNISELSLWDTANSDLNTRQLWLKVRKSLFLSHLEVSYASYSKVQWLIKRNVSTPATKVCWHLSSIQTGLSRLTGVLAADRVPVFSTKSNVRHLEISVSDVDTNKLEVYDIIFRSDFVRALCKEPTAGMPQLRTFKLSGLAYISPDEFNLIVSQCPNLVRLDVCLTSGRALEHLEHCPNLRTLCLYFLTCEVNIGMQHLAKYGKNLKRLRISQSTVTDSGLKLLAVGPLQLIKLMLDGCYDVTSTGIEDLAISCRDYLQFICLAIVLSDDVLQHLATCPNLTSIDFMPCKNSSSCSDFGLSALSVGCRNLKVLQLPWSPALVTVSAVLTLTGSCHGLLSIMFACAIMIDDAAITKIGDFCPHLLQVHIHYSPITDNGVSKLRQNLRCVSLAGCENITDAALDLLLSSDYGELDTINVNKCPGISPHRRKSHRINRGVSTWYQCLPHF